MRKRVHLLILLSLAVESSSCHVWFTKRKPNIPMAPVVLPDPKPIPPEPTLPGPPPKLGESPNPTAPAIPPEKIVTPPGPQRPRPVRRRPVAAAPKVVIEQQQGSQEQPQPTAPKLGQIFTTEQRNEYNKTLDDALNRVRGVLVQASVRQLSEPQHDVVNRIRAFEKQALQARDQDLLAALSLANRADVLARELAAQFQ